MSTAATLIWLAQIWLYIGAAIAVAFLMVGIGRVDQDASGSFTFRPLLVPAVLLIWPLVLWRWVQAEQNGLDTVVQRDRPLREAHARVWLALAVAIPVILFGSIALRQSPPEAGESAVQITSQPE